MKFRTERRSIQGLEVFAVRKLHCGEWVDWVYICQSCIPGAGRGVFAARDFEDSEFIGRYLGRVLGFRVDFTDAVLKVHARLHRCSAKGSRHTSSSCMMAGALIHGGRLPISIDANEYGVHTDKN